jgi:hypothetical protein
MTATLTSQNGQSMYDLCLQAYGTLDHLVKFCVDNQISDVNYNPVAPQSFQYDTTLVVAQYTGYAFCTGIATGSDTEFGEVFSEAFG